MASADAVLVGIAGAGPGWGMTGASSRRQLPERDSKRRLHCVMQLTRLELVERKSFYGMDCSVAQCLEQVGEWWSLLILRDCFLGVSRFDSFQRRLGISRNILQRRLTHLLEMGVLSRVPYSEHPARYHYRLTDKGRALWPVLTALREWGDRYAAPQGPPLRIVHEGCGQVAETVICCSACGRAMGPRDVAAVPGPGREGSSLLPSG